MTDLAIDVGGTKTLVAVFEDDQVKPLCVEKFPTDSAAGPEDFIVRLMKVCLKYVVPPDVRYWGLCTAGAVDVSTGRLIWSPNLGWKDINLYEKLSQLFGYRGVVENDCNAAAYGEWSARPGIDSLVYVTVSTGIGMGIVSSGRIIRGSHGTAGEIGHTTVLPDGPECTCGRRGCLQAIAGGRGLSRQVERLFGKRLTAEEIIDLARAGEPEYVEIVVEAATILGRFFANMIDTLDPAVLVIGGSLGKNPHYRRLVVDFFTKFYYRLPDKTVGIEPPSAEPDPGIIGVLKLSRSMGVKKSGKSDQILGS
jgi:glucokinase